MTFQVYESASQIKRSHSEGIVGGPARTSPHDQTVTATNVGYRALLVMTLTVASLGNGTEYEVPVLDESGDVLSTVTFEGGATDADSAANLAAAWNSNGFTRSDATADAAVVTVTARWAHILFAIGTVDPKITVATVNNAANATRIPFGRLVLSDATLGGSRGCRLPVKGELLGTSYIFGIVYESGAEVVATVKDANGKIYSAAFTMATDEATSLAGIASALNDALPVDLAAAAVVSTDVVLSGSGLLDFTLSLAVKGETTGSATISTEGHASIGGYVLGLSARRGDIAPASLDINDRAYGDGEGVEVVIIGERWVEIDAAEPVAFGVPVYVGTGAGEEGRFYAAPGADRFQLPSHVARWSRKGANDPTIAAVALTISNA